MLAPDSRNELTWDLVLGQYGPDVEFLQEAFRQTMGRCTVDRQRLTVAGHSDGASYSLSFGIGAGDVFGHVIAMSPGVMSPVAARGKPKIFISHGVSDTTMPIDDTSRKFVPRLKGLGYDVTYREYDGGHGAPAPVVREAFEWLQRLKGDHTMDLKTRATNILTKPAAEWPVIADRDARRRPTSSRAMPRRCRPFPRSAVSSACRSSASRFR